MFLHFLSELAEIIVRCPYDSCDCDLDGPIRANQFADSRESPDSRESFQGFRTEPFFCCESRFRGLTIANHRFESICANGSHVMKIVLLIFSAYRLARIDSRESLAPIRVANRRAIHVNAKLHRPLNGPF